LSAPTLVVLRALGLGDFLAGVPAYRALARKFPEHRRLLAAPRALHALLPLLGDTFAAGVAAEPLAELPGSARDAAIGVNLHGRGPQSHRVLLAARAQRLIAFAHPHIAQSSSGARWFAHEHEVARWCRMLGHAGIPADPAALVIGVPPVEVPAALRGATLVHPGAASVARRWPAASWATVARACEARGERVIVTGAAYERGLAALVTRRAALPARRNIAGRTSLVELAALVAQARRLICGDTGIAHLASAYAVPSIVLFGPTAPAEWGPPARERHRVLWAGRGGDPHGDVSDPGLLAISPADVIAEVERLATSAEGPVRGS